MAPTNPTDPEAGDPWDEDWRDRPPDPEPPLWEADPESPPHAAPPLVTPALLHALAAAEDALSRLDAGALAATPAVREGLAARLAFREAAGWLAHAETWVHPLDLALRDLGLTGSLAAAALAGRLGASLPATVARGGPQAGDAGESLPEDRSVALALALARGLRRLGTAATWRPLASPAAMAEALAPLGGGMDAAGFARWQAAQKAAARDWPALPAALVAAGAWQAAGPDRRDGRLQAGFLAAASLAAAGRLGAIPLPFWAALPARPARLWREAPGFGEAALVDGLRQVARAAAAGLAELTRLTEAAARGAGLIAGVDARSRLPGAVEAALRLPVLTPGALARRLGVVPQTATDLLRRLAAAGVLREATGRRSYRAFTI